MANQKETTDCEFVEGLSRELTQEKGKKLRKIYKNVRRRAEFKHDKWIEAGNRVAGEQQGLQEAAEAARDTAEEKTKIERQKRITAEGEVANLKTK